VTGEYPFGRAAGSFDLGDPCHPPPPSGAVPLLAYGANASPERLEAKLPGVRVAALAAELRGWAVVHSAHVSPYGSVPATLVEVEGAVEQVHVLLVGELAPLDETEPNYDRVRLEGLDLEADRLGPIEVADAYLSKWGPLLIDGRPVPLGSRPQAELLALVREGA
jgi:hypothetical protein